MMRALPPSFMFGDGIDWNSELVDVSLMVELPFWLMIPVGPVEVSWSGVRFTIEVCSPWMEVFAAKFLDSRQSCVYQGPRPQGGYEPSDELRVALAEHPATLMERPCKTVLRLSARAHADALRTLAESDPPRAYREHETYLESLCEAHIPVVNELIQRYRLVTYDHFAYEVSPWDVPIWYVEQGGHGDLAVIHPYRMFDVESVVIENSELSGLPPSVRPLEWSSPEQLEAASSSDASPGEYDLLDARSLMERGDYTGAVRRSVSAIEAIIERQLRVALEKRYGSPDADRRLDATKDDVPGRLRQWRKLTKAPLSDERLAEFETTRAIRHDIVHRARRLGPEERGRAQRAVDTTRWLYDTIEGRPDRANLRDYGVLKSAGRHGLVLRFPALLSDPGITLDRPSG